jgi:hypothetical protein
LEKGVVVQMVKSEVMRRGLWWVVLVALCASGCGKPAWEEPSPRSVFEQFLVHSLRGQSEQAWGSVDPQARERLLAARTELVGLVGEEKVGLTPAQMLVVGSVDHPMDIKRVEVVDPPSKEPAQGHILVLRLMYVDGREGEARLVWRDGRWFVKLPVGADQEG